MTNFARRKPVSIAAAQVCSAILFAVLAAAGAIGCDDDDEDFTVEGPNAIASTSQPIGASDSATNCTAERLAKLQSALEYASNRVNDGLYVFAECLNRSYLWGANGQNGWHIGPMVAASPITRIDCAGPAKLPNQVSVSGKRLSADNTFIDNNGIVPIAAAIVREVLQDRGFGPGSGTNLVDAHDANRVSVQGEACVRLWHGIPAVDKGFTLWWDGTQVGNEPNYDRASAVTVCAWNRKTHPAKKVECYFDNARLGYELYRDGFDLASRVGIEPGYTRAEAAANCEYNVKTNPRTWHTCLFDGAPIGFELYRDKVREVQEPKWTKEKAVSECDWRRKTYPRDKVECYFDGRGVGYELLWDGSRVELEPTWTESQAATDCAWNKKIYPAKVVDCRFDGHALADPQESAPSIQQESEEALGARKPGGRIRSKTAR
jgi:hypothetical protein